MSGELDVHKPPVKSLQIGMTGIAVDDIDKGTRGWAYFPIGSPDSRGQPTWVRYKIFAVEEIRSKRDVIVVEEGDQCKEHTPQELKFETVDEHWRRVTENYGLPVTTAGVKDDFARITTAAVAERYIVGTNAYKADPKVAWGETFTATKMTVLCAQNAWVRLNGEKRVRHYIPANIPVEFPTKITEFRIVQDTVAGQANIWMFG